jgi:hypothetical protein
LTVRTPIDLLFQNLFGTQDKPLRAFGTLSPQLLLA